MQTAIQELKGMVKNIPLLINEGEAQDYVFMCVKSKDTLDGTSKVHSGKVLYASESKYHEMVADIKRHGGLFNGMFNKIVMLNDPTMLPHIEDPKKKNLKD